MVIYRRAAPHSAGLTGEPPPRQTEENYFARSAEDAPATDSIGQVIALWPPVAGRYPAQAYQAGLALPLVLQTMALLWFAWPRRVPQPA